MKVAICSPSRDMVHAGFAFDLAALTAYWTARASLEGDNMALFSSVGTLIADQRCQIAEQALVAGADWLLWLDTDMRFPKDALTRLLAHNKPVVAANYVTRVIPPRPVSKRRDGDRWIGVPTTEEKAGLEEVDFTGLGCALVSAQVMRTLEQPWFNIVYSSNGVFHGEDAYFCGKAKAAGFGVFVDHDLSREIRHIGSIEYSHDHVIEVEHGNH